MITEKDAYDFANHWVEAWNSYDIDEIMSHYAADVILVSSAAAKILNDSSGRVKGKKALRSYFTKGLEAYPSLKFELVDVLWGRSSIVLYYVNQKGTKTAEFMELNAEGEVVRVIAHYNS